jgi:hypothetical protein
VLALGRDSWRFPQQVLGRGRRSGGFAALVCRRALNLLLRCSGSAFSAGTSTPNLARILRVGLRGQSDHRDGRGAAAGSTTFRIPCQLAGFRAARTVAQLAGGIVAPGHDGAVLEQGQCVRCAGDSYEDYVAALRSKLTPGCHLVAMSSSAVALLAADGDDDLATLVISALIVPPATFRAMGMAAAAEASQAMLNAMVDGRGMLDLFARALEGAPEDTAYRLLALVDRELDREDVARYIPTFARINLVEIAPRPTAPTLFLWSHRAPL